MLIYHSRTRDAMVLGSYLATGPKYLTDFRLGSAELLPP